MPNENMTRAQLAAMLSRVLNLSAPGMVPEFSDVSADAWYADCVGAITARGFMAGKGSGTFDPNGIVTSQELFCVLSTISEWCSITGKRNAEESFSAYQWMDFYNYPEWAQVSARNMEALGLNVDRENPSASVTRGTAAGMLCQLMETLGMFWF
jgi:glucosylceramidase